MKILRLDLGLGILAALLLGKNEAYSPLKTRVRGRHVFLFTLFSATTACVAPAKLSVNNLAASASTPVIDMRPASESRRESFSLLITSERYGYFRAGQESTNPTGARLFAHRLQEKYAPAVAPTTTLRHFVVYMNARTDLKRTSTEFALGSGILGGLIANAGGNREGTVSNSLVDEAAFNSMSGEKEFKRAIFDNSQAPPTTSAYIIYIETESLGARRFTRTVWPIKKPQAKEATPLPDALEAAIAFHLKD